jgi:hypothetical protein
VYLHENKMDDGLGGGLLAGPAVAAFCHNGLVEPVSEVIGKLVQLIIAVNFDGFLGGIHYHVAFVAPMEMLIQLDSKVLADLPIEVIGQLF